MTAPATGSRRRLPGRPSRTSPPTSPTSRTPWGSTASPSPAGRAARRTALACGALLRDRVTRCASVVGPAPYGAAWPGARRTGCAVWSRATCGSSSSSLAGEDALRPELQRETDEMLANLGKDPEHPDGRGV